MQGIAIAPKERKDLIRRIKRERKPSRRLRMHIVLLATDGYPPTRVSRVLFCSRTTVYAIVGRFVREGRGAFDDRKKRGPTPLLDGSAQKRIETLLEEGWPPARGWSRSRWGCRLLMPQPFKERAPLVSRETVSRRALHHLLFRWRRPRPVPPPEDPKQKRKRLLDVLGMLRREGSFFQDETELELNPRVGFCWMRKGEQQKLPTPGTNQKVWISGALNFSTGRFYWVSGPNKNSELFLKLLKELRRRVYRRYRQPHLAVDNDASHTSKRVEEYLSSSRERLRLHPLPARSPQSNPVGLIWWGLHEAVGRNHRCKDLSGLLEFAESYLQERQPFRLQLGADYRQLQRPPP